MKIILAVMGAVIVILVVALGAAFMDKPDVLILEEPVRLVEDIRDFFRGLR